MKSNCGIPWSAFLLSESCLLVHYLIDQSSSRLLMARGSWLMAKTRAWPSPNPGPPETFCSITSDEPLTMV